MNTYNYDEIFKDIESRHGLEVLDLIQNGGEPADAAGNMGPDSDKNWGYEGILYVSAGMILLKPLRTT